MTERLTDAALRLVAEAIVHVMRDYIEGYATGQHDAVSWLERGNDGDAPLAAICHQVQPRAWAWCLAQNFRVVAFGQAMFNAGRLRGFWECPGDQTEASLDWDHIEQHTWRPNCDGRAMPGMDER